MAKTATQQVGTTWEISTTKDSLPVERPDGAVVDVVAVDGVVLHVLTQAGDYRAGTHHVTATAADQNRS